MKEKILEILNKKISKDKMAKEIEELFLVCSTGEVPEFYSSPVIKFDSKTGGSGMMFGIRG